MKLSYNAMRELGIKAFLAAGVPDDTASCVTDALLLAELDGMPSHGFSRIPFYVDQAKTGKVKAAARPVVSKPAPAVVCVDACNGYAFPAINEGHPRSSYTVSGLPSKSGSKKCLSIFASIKAPYWWFPS